MKRALIFFSCLVVLLIIISQQSCHYSVSQVDDVDSVAVIDSSDIIVDEFFTKFQESNTEWFKTKEGHNKLIKAFREKFTSDINFAKSCANSTCEYVSIRLSESIAQYNNKNNVNEEGEIKAFDIIIKINLLKPLYNGQRYVELKYELINSIPSTIENHDIPYIDNVNYSNTFNPFMKNSYDGTLDIGCYILTKKE
jgi:hypothetical protein